MSRKLALVQWSKTLAVLLIIAGLQILLLDVALFIAYDKCFIKFSNTGKKNRIFFKEIL